MNADLLVEVRAAQTASLTRSLERAAVVASIATDGVVVGARRNRPFRLEDVIALIREWMQAHAVDAVFATCGGDLFSVVPTDDRVIRPGAVPSHRDFRRGRQTPPPGHAHVQN